MKQFARVLTAVVCMGLTVASSTCLAAIPRNSRAFKFNLTRNWAEFNVLSVRPIEMANVVHTEDIAKIIPLDMVASNDGSTIGAAILDHSLSNFFNSAAVRNSEIGRTAHEIDDKMQGDVSFGGNQPESVKHQVKFAMRAAQARAQIEYTGLTNAQLSYNIAQSKMNLEVREEMASLGTHVVFNHITAPEDQVDMVSLRWVW